MKVIDFLENFFELDTFCLFKSIKRGENFKKIPVGLPSGRYNWTSEELIDWNTEKLENKSFNAVEIFLWKTPYWVVDTDNEEAYNFITKNFPTILNTTLTFSRQDNFHRHFLIEFIGEFPKNSKTKIVKVNNIDLDLLGNFVFEELDREIHNESILSIDINSLITFKKPKPITETLQVLNPNQIVPDNKNQEETIKTIEYILSILDPNKYKGYSAWTGIGYIIHNEIQDKTVGIKLFKNFCMRMSNYEEAELYKFWNSIDLSSKYCLNPLTLSSLYYYFKKDYPKLYLEKKNELNLKTKNFEKDTFNKLKSNDDKLAYFNQFHFYNNNDGLYYTIKDRTIKGHTETKFKNSIAPIRIPKKFTNNKKNPNENNENENENDIPEEVIIKYEGIFNVWNTHNERSEYDNMYLYPPPLSVPSNYINKFRGFAIEEHNISINELNDKENIRQFNCVLGFLYYLSGECDISYEYLLKFYAHLFQKPGEIPRIALVFKSTTGCGKDLWISFIISILGAEFIYKTSKLKDIVGDFNSAIDSKLICVANEVEPKTFNDFKENIKEFITEENISLVRKGIDPITVPNYSRLIFHTNNNFPVELNDRRFAIFGCSPVVKKLNLTEHYFSKIAKYLKNPVVQKLFYNYCLNIDIENYNFELNRPKTDIYKQSINKPIYLQFLIDKFEKLLKTEPSDWNGIKKFKKLDLLNEYNLWVQNPNNCGLQIPPTRTAQKFKIEITSTLLEKLDLYFDKDTKDINIQYVVIRKSNGNEYYEFNVSELYKLFIEKNIAEEVDKTTNETLQMETDSENEIVDFSEFED